MRIFNGKKSQLNLPLVGSNERLSINSLSASKEFMPNEDFLSLVVTSYDTDEVAIIVSGPFEVSMCSRISSCNGLVVNSLEEAIRRFVPEVEPETPVKPLEITKKIVEEIKIPVADEAQNPGSEEVSPVIAFHSPEIDKVPEETVVPETEETSAPEAIQEAVANEDVPAENPEPTPKVRRRVRIRKTVTPTDDTTIVTE